MEALKFILRGESAFFKVPEVNSYGYFTYGNIHKPALLGIFGAILGYNGYANQSDQKLDFPEYYTRLQNLKISIVPGREDGYFSRKIQQFNNSVGYASKEAGGNLIVSEQWLENPQWTIYVCMNHEEAVKLSEMLLNHKAVYVPYLGKNDHPATIEKVEIVALNRAEVEGGQVQSICPAGSFEYDLYTMDYKYEEFLPTGLKESTNHYKMQKFILTNAEVETQHVEVYTDEVNHIVFY